MMRLSVEGALMLCYLFLKDVTKRCGRKPILTIEARWYDEACRWLRLSHSSYPIKQKKLIERFPRRSMMGRNASTIRSHAGERDTTGITHGIG
jgi:transposase-like protein